MPKLLRVYQVVVLTLVHALLLFAVANGAAWAILRYRPSDPITLTYGQVPLERIYPGRTRDDVRELLRETWTRRPVFEPFLVSRERKFRGRFVNVSPEGFRLVQNQAPWPPDPARLNVFVFGGSTAFGYGVSDEETIASALQAQLAGAAPRAVACYNFGRGGYYSTQERILFEEFLAAGLVPDVAVFVDGLNEFAFEVPWLTTSLHNVLASPVQAAARTLVDQLPLSRLLAERKAARPQPAVGSVDGYNDRPRLAANVARYLGNRRLVTTLARAQQVQVLFVWQPIPLYAYDLDAHAFGRFDFAHNNYARFGYPMMAEQRPEASDFFWAADLQKDLHEPLYVDQVHYTAAMNRRVAEAIGRALEERGVLRAAQTRRPVA